MKNIKFPKCECQMSNVNVRLGHFRSVYLVRYQKITSDLKLSFVLVRVCRLE